MTAALSANFLHRAQVSDQPFAFLYAGGALDPSAAHGLLADFPRYRGAGFFPWDAADCGPSINALVGALVAPTFADRLGERLGIERLSQYPTLVTLCRALNRRHGTIHTDSRSKVVTALVYLSPDWPDTSAGCLRFLARADDIESTLAPELRPVYGAFAAFRRTDCSWHGHLPHEGERPVIQVAWLTSADEAARKTRRGRFSRMVKWIAGRLDGWFGRSRDPNAGHLE
jgi:hypothetical protein